MGDPSLPTFPRGQEPPGVRPAWLARLWRAVKKHSTLVLILEIALGLRIAAADLVQIYVDWKSIESTDPAHPSVCIFPDTYYYWELAQAIREGSPYEVMFYGDIPHFTLRTPGYPLFLAACQSIFGARAFPVRLVQAVLGTLSVWLVYQLTRAITTPVVARDNETHSAIPLVATALAAIEPYTISVSPLILSEALFIPFMLSMLWGMAVLWRSPFGLTGGTSTWISLAVGASNALAVLVRPSWILFMPFLLAFWMMTALMTEQRTESTNRGEPARRLKSSCLIVLGFVLVMSPWWIRNQAIYGRLVPTALWTGASLYDGLSPQATGASDMSFLGDADIWPLGEEDQDAELMARALTFARTEPWQAFGLALNKLGRYWRPWPDAGIRSSPIVVTSVAITVPLFVLIANGFWRSRRDPLACVLLAGPVIYFCLLHTVFASSMRYRVPGEIPAFGLAAIGLDPMLKWLRLSIV